MIKQYYRFIIGRNLCKIVFIGLLLVLLISCKENSQSLQSQYTEHRTVVYDTMRKVQPGLYDPTGRVLNPGESIQTSFSLSPPDHKMKRSIRVKGSSVLPERFGKKDEVSFREHHYLIDDYLDANDGYNEAYALVFEGTNEPFEKNAYYKLEEDRLARFIGSKMQIQFPVKPSIESFGKDGYFKLRLQLYKKKEGQHVDDIFDDADDIWELNVPVGNSDWHVLSKAFEIPNDIACILVQITSFNMSGMCKVGTPKFKGKDKSLVLNPLQPFVGNQDDWIGENLSTKEWPEFEFSVDGQPFYTGKVFDRASGISEFDVNLPELSAGDHELSMKLIDRGVPARLSFLVKTIEVHENSARDFEVVYVPNMVSSDKEFAILIEINKPGVQLRISGDEQIVPLENKKAFEETGLYSLVFEAGAPITNQKIRVSDGANEVVGNIRQILKRDDDGVFISNGDDIYIGRNKEQFAKYLKWYMREGVGNSYCWRPSYQWSGARDADPEFYNWALGLLKDLKMPYSLMTEGRTISGRNINPSAEIMDSPLFMGKQSHEDDGCFNYWLHFKYEGLYSDLAAKFRPYGGIFAKSRLIYTEGGPHVFFDPYGVKDMADGAKTFVNNLSKARGPSIRHTGPSTLFRYFLQAGYDWVGAEQMYSAEEVTMSSLRGASKAYGKKDFGTHLATQWGTEPFNKTEHATRLFLSLAVSYIHGATHINTEDGLWNIEAGTDRYSPEGKAHIKRQRNLLHYIQTHERRGNLVAPIAIIQGRNDSWRCINKTGTVWSQQGDEWAMGAADDSYDLIKTYYPNSVLDYIQMLKHEPRTQKGWYTATPYGLVDLLPIEAPQDVLDDYEAIIFLGWNTYQEADFEKLLSYVKKGKTLLLTGNHINTELMPNRPTQYPKKDGVLFELLGPDYKNKKKPYRNRVGKGEVIFYPQKLYPAESPIRNQYEQDMKEIGEKVVNNQLEKGWIEAAENIEFAVWHDEATNIRTIYLLNIDWWSAQTSHPASLIIGDTKFPLNSIRRDVLETVTIFQEVAVMPESMTTGILDISKTEQGYEITIQTTEKDVLSVYHKQKGIQNYELENAGIHKIKI
ncbi:hypothetical protein [Seonamhaeicola sp.]|uniref:hypothetical protein n=1 Tax=Seonamhaeicola sp. TaxID=1912245 RepID=UPI00260EFCEA|nr:hypothetical protein [Seonamhaeicola sp.]